MALLSMTGFGRADFQIGESHFFIEIKSVNNRFLQIESRLPPQFSEFENGLRSLFAENFRRGKFSLFLREETGQNPPPEFEVNGEQIAKLLTQLRAIEPGAGVGLPHLLAIPGLIRPREINRPPRERVEKVLFEAARKAIAELTDLRRREGANLQARIEGYLKSFTAIVDEIAAQRQTETELFEEKFRKRLSAIRPSETPFSEERILTEVAIFVERGQIDEEIDRIHSHLRLLSETLAGEGEAGRKLDFILQELNRETNTIGSKSASIAITQRVVLMKELLEKVREQIQNIE